MDMYICIYVFDPIVTEEAIKQGQEAIEGWIMTAQADGATVPPPRNYTDMIA